MVFSHPEEQPGGQKKVYSSGVNKIMFVHLLLIEKYSAFCTWRQVSHTIQLFYFQYLSSVTESEKLLI